LCGSQFFITFGPAPELDKKHTLLGKITGNTIFNFMTLNESEVDSDNRPVRPEKITSTRILSNPFDDIVPRRIVHEKRHKEKKEKHEGGSAKTRKNTGSPQPVSTQ
jgi:peptidyl-prolyl cis-trans isomerase SDCCAG10